MARYGYTLEQAQEMRRQYEAGATLQQLVNQHGGALSTIARNIRRAGGTIRPTGYVKGNKSNKHIRNGLVRWVNETNIPAE